MVGTFVIKAILIKPIILHISRFILNTSSNKILPYWEKTHFYDTIYILNKCRQEIIANTIYLRQLYTSDLFNSFDNDVDFY